MSLATATASWENFDGKGNTASYRKRLSVRCSAARKESKVVKLSNIFGHSSGVENYASQFDKVSFWFNAKLTAVLKLYDGTNKVMAIAETILLVDKLLSNYGQTGYDVCDRYMAETMPDGLPRHMIMAMLSETKRIGRIPNSPKLKNRTTFYDRTVQNFIQRVGPDDARKLLEKYK